MTGDFKMDLLGIGVPRGGSTWLHYTLHEHPEICMGSTKELNYYQQNKNTKTRHGRTLESFFSHCAAHTLKGDFSPSTFSGGEKIIKAIKADNPDMKLILCLRDPSKRAYSLFLKHKLAGVGPIEQDETLEEIVDRWEPAYHRYIRKSLYSENLKKWKEAFNDDQLFIILFYELFEDPKKVVRGIYEFLGVDPEFTPTTLQRKINRVGRHAVVFRSLTRKIRGLGRFNQRILDAVGFGSLRTLNHRFISLLHKLNSKKVNKADYPMPPSTKEYLHKVFKEDIEKVETLLGKDLDHWKR